MLLRFGWVLPLAGLLVGALVLLLTYAFASIPLPRDVPLDQTARVYDRNGKLIGTFSGAERRFIIPVERIPEHVKQAVIAAEDRSFYEHNGVSLRGITRAAWANLTGGVVSQGGSTIDQQYIKNAVLKDSSRTISRKFKEAILAIKLERRYSKEEILGFYLNTIYLGRGAYGIEAAAKAYFDKNAKDLSLAEGAYLASIIPAPESYQPNRNREGALERRNRVLGIMAEEGFITQAEADRVRGEKLGITKKGLEDKKNQTAAYFMEWLRRKYLEPKFGNDLYTAGLKIYTTLDLDMQHAAEERIEEILFDEGDPQASIVSMTPRGAVRVFVGGRHYTNLKRARGTIYASDLPGHQSGSALKPFTLLGSIEEGISPQSLFSGASPATIEDPACAGPDGLWRPENFGGSSYGTLTLDQATTNSVNTIYAQLAAEIGPQKIADVLDRFGFAPKFGAKEIPPNCSLALGAFTSTPLEMARAYAGFAGRGELPEVVPIRYVENSDGDCLVGYLQKRDDCREREKVGSKKIAEANDVDVLTQSLTRVVTSGTAAGTVSLGRPVAGKTGTAQDNVASWFAGYVPQLATAVWLGYPLEPGPDGKKGTNDDFVPRMGFCADPNVCRPVHGIEVTGGSFPAQIWNAYMLDAVAGLEVQEFAVPSDMPDEVLNEAPPEPPPPTESKSPKPKPTEEPTPDPEPTEEPTPDPEPTEPAPTPTSGKGFAGALAGAVMAAWIRRGGPP
jgi:membrane peptidoglycan carboxypeptidase